MWPADALAEVASVFPREQHEGEVCSEEREMEWSASLDLRNPEQIGQSSGLRRNESAPGEYLRQGMLPNAYKLVQIPTVPS